jgi:hypothetical protein
MKLEDLVKGLKDGSVKILGNHRTNSLIERLERDIKHNAEAREKFKDRPSMLSMIENNETVRFGHYLGSGSEQYCFDCGGRMYIIPLDEHTIAYCDGSEYWDLADKSGKKYDFLMTRDHVKECEASHLREAKKLSVEIELESGKIVFCNHFGEKPILDLPKEEEHSEPSINCILGRARVMKYLGSQNVGYGQMGNMSVTIYSNPDDEILIGEDDGNDRIYDLENSLSGKYGELKEEDRKRNTATLERYKEFEKILKDGKYKIRGQVSCRVWRWMCADDAHVKRVKAKPSNEGEKAVRFNVKPGKYTVEHYYDFQDGPIYSRLIPK